MTSLDVFITGAVIVASLSVPLAAQRLTLARAERRWIFYGWLAHVVASIGFMVILFNVYGSGDLFVYHRHGGAIADMIRAMPDIYLPMSVEVFLQRSTPLDELLYADGATASMTAAAAWLFLLTNNSLPGACMLLAMLVFASRIAMYCAFRIHFHTHRARLYLAAACFGVPSVLFWTGGVVKEAAACVGLGLLIWGAYGVLVHRRYALTSVALLIGGLILSMIKAYILIAFIASIATFYTLRRAIAAGKIYNIFSPKNIIISIIMLTLGVYIVSIIAPRFAIDRLAEEAAKLQAYSGKNMGDSDYNIGDKDATTIAGQSVFFPLALFTSLFRPLVFEIHNVTAALSALEMLFIQLLILRTLRRAGWREVVMRLLSNPTLGFCAAFVLIFGVGVGLSTTNLGTLSRYRAPMMPFYLLLILSLSLPYATTSARRTTRR